MAVSPTLVCSMNERSYFRTIITLVSAPIPVKEDIEKAEAIFKEATQSKAWTSDPSEYERFWGRLSFRYQAEQAITLAWTRYKSSLQPVEPLEFSKEAVVKPIKPIKPIRRPPSGLSQLFNPSSPFSSSSSSS